MTIIVPRLDEMPISHFNDFKLGLKCNNFKHFKQFGLSTLRMLCPPIRRAAGSTLRDARCAVAVAVGMTATKIWQKATIDFLT